MKALRRNSKLWIIVWFAFAVALVAYAADPPQGTVSQASPEQLWDGPVVMAPTASASCAGPNDPACDNFRLNIVPPASGSFQVKITIQPFGGGDWDLQVYAPNGTVVGSSGNAPSQQELVTLNNPAAGTYTVAAAPFAPSPGTPVMGMTSYAGRAELILLPTPPPPPDPGSEPISYFNHVAPAPFGRPSSDEPSIGCNYKTDRVMFTGVLQTLQVTYDNCTSPALDTWRDVSFLTTSLITLDPILFTDRVTGRTIVSQLSAKCSNMAFTDNDGGVDGQAPGDWIPSQGCGINSGVDHQTVGGGRFHDPLTRDPNGPLYPHAVYYCSQDIALAQCGRSDTGGLTFGPAVPIYNLTTCGGLHGQVKVSPADGTVYVPNRNCGGEQAVVVSEDNGMTWTPRQIPNAAPGNLDPTVSVATDGTVYFGWNNAGVEPMVAVSQNKGVSWINPRNVGAPFGIQSSIFTTVAAGDPDRAMIAFHGSTTAGGGGDDPTWPGDFFLYVAHTYDTGNTWTTIQASPDPVQRATICPFGIGCENGTRNLLDFFGATIDREGRGLVGYADGCVGNCTKARPNSFTAVSTIARQVNGRRLFAQFDVSGVPASPLVTATFNACPNPSAVTLAWSQPDDRGSAIISFRIYRRTSTGSFALLATVPGNVNQYSDNTIDPSQTYFYRVTAVNALGESTPCGEVSVSCPGGGQPEDPCEFPGVTVLTDATGDATGGLAEHDIVKLSIAEPGDLGAGKIMFVLKMVGLQNSPPDNTWPILFKAPNGTDFAARMHTNAAAQVFFTVATGANNTNPLLNAGTPADPASGFSADGTIRIVVSRAAIGNPLPGQMLDQFLIRIRVEGGAVALTPDNMPDSLARAGTYTVKGSENCVCNAPDAVDDSATTTENNPVAINVIANDSDGGSPPLTVTAVTQGANGAVTNNSDGTVTYRPNSGFVGTDTFTYTVKNSCGATDSASVQVNVVRRETCIEDDDPRIAYQNGWHQNDHSAASAGHFRFNTGKDRQHGAALTFEIEAAAGSITYEFAKSQKAGTADIYMDGTFMETINYSGPNGSIHMHDPEFGCADCSRTYEVTRGTHTLEIRNVNGFVYVDRFCVRNGGSTSQPATGPGTTSSSSDVVAVGLDLIRTVALGTNALELSVVAEASSGVPIRLVLIDPSGSILKTADASSGLAAINVPVSQAGIYVIKVVNLSLGPVEVWTAATPLIRR